MKLIREPAVLERVPFSRPTLRRKIKEGTFPAPVNIGARAVAWVVDEIDAWEQEIIERRGKKNQPKAA